LPKALLGKTMRGEVLSTRQHLVRRQTTPS
jgi:hypothetical protein